MATFDELIAQAKAAIPDISPQIEAQRVAEVEALDKQRAYQAELLRKQLENASQQAYITREMQRRDLPSYLAQQGLTGGITETAANDLLRSYRNSVNAARNTYSDNTNSLENTYATNLAGINTTYSQRLMDAMAQRRAEELQRAVLAAQYGGATPANGSIIATEENEKPYIAPIITTSKNGGAGAQASQSTYNPSYNAGNFSKVSGKPLGATSTWNKAAGKPLGSLYKTVSGKYF